MIELSCVYRIEDGELGNYLVSIFLFIAVIVLPGQVFSSILPARAVETTFRLYTSLVVWIHLRRANTCLLADIFLAIPAPDRWLDDLVVGDGHVQVGDCKQGKANSEEVEHILDEESGNRSEKHSTLVSTSR